MERLVYVDSTARDTSLYPSGSNYVLHLTDVVRSVSRIDLVAAKVPNSLYNITNGSNVATVTGVSNVSNVSILSGFYSAYGLQDALTSSSNTAVAYQYLPDEARYFVYSAVPFTVTFNTGEIAKLTGFDVGKVYTGQPASTSPVYKNDPTYASYYIVLSPNTVNFILNEFVFLDVQELRTPSMLDAKPMDARTGTYTGASARRSFAMIQMDVASGCIKNFKESNDYRVSVFYPEPINSIDRLTVQWYDKTGSLLNFEGFENNAFVLRFYIANDRPELPPPPAVPEVEIKRIIDAMTALPPKPEPKKKPALGRWLLYILLFVSILWGIHWYRKAAELKATVPVAPPQLPHVLRTPQ